MPRIELTPRARELRARQTDPERLLWSKLRNRQLGGWKWKRQAPRGPFVADFYCAEARLVVELDGGQHAEAAGAAYDAWRTEKLEAGGLTVLRFWNAEVIENLDGVCDTVLAACGGENGKSADATSPA